MKAAEIAQRRKEITSWLYQQEVVKVGELVKHFRVSDETIRKDLAHLEQEGILKKEHGKAVLVKEKELDPVSLRTVNLTEKERIVAKALSLITENDCVIGLDQGSTIALLAKKLGSLDQRQLFTGSLAAILQLVNSQHLIHCFGGQYSAGDMAFRNDTGKEMYPDVQFDLCFFGSSGVKNRKGFCTSSLIDAESKRMMLRKSTKKIVLLDNSKFEATSLVQVAPWSEVDIVITNKGIPRDYERMISAFAQLILV
ncbi:DeoR/GlpR transcriptional regulator [Enterococcus sp. 669A]|uniref:DeoR/GlpR transcriptional regulator n=1 Tax=Candidatus Enterococcus moelleringii TaxID=2815325 RepID=A0ABS3LHJ0_9ENTE|nr:DeoR/GlpR family DNA-binding transcription regulator [Enterococcus sp. 669A]MBO1308176.1 DeoR/GlpR transcriptional regulator [Enterococcus sp. 669A]